MQMLQALYRKGSDCTLVVSAGPDDDDGYVYVKEGYVIAAAQGSLEGPDAVDEMMAWADPSIAVYSLPAQIVSNINPDVAADYVQDWPDPSDAPYGAGEPALSMPAPDESSAFRQVTITDSLQETLKRAMEVDGALSVAVIDWTSGVALASISHGLDITVAAGGNSDVVRAKIKLMKALGLDDQIEDILITLGSQYHLIRILASNPSLFIYLALDKAQANLAMARYQLGEAEQHLVV